MAKYDYYEDLEEQAYQDSITPKKKPKNKKGFQSEIKNLLKSDKDNSITIEKKII